MKKIQCVRIEHPLTGWGIFRSSDFGKHLTLSQMRLDSITTRHGCSFPTPRNDGLIIRLDGEEWFCAYKSVSQMQEWIYNEEISTLIKNGFNVLLLEVNDYQIGNHQVIFVDNEDVKRKVINDLFR